jgi:hypothetical protein
VHEDLEAAHKRAADATRIHDAHLQDEMILQPLHGRQRSRSTALSYGSETPAELSDGRE